MYEKLEKDKIIEEEFKVPDSTEDAQDEIMEQIGKKLIDTNENYEEIFISSSNH
jgi:hypothetical protein